MQDKIHLFCLQQKFGRLIDTLEPCYLQGTECGDLKLWSYIKHFLYT
jgi:hypothetical protein